MSMLFKRIKDWATSITAFRTGDVIPVDGPSGTAKMSKDTLLELTAQNALAGNVAPAFDPTRTSENPYLAGETVMYEGVRYVFKVNHYGAWDASDVSLLPISLCTDINNEENFLYNDNFKLELSILERYINTDGTVSRAGQTNCVCSDFIKVPSLKLHYKGNCGYDATCVAYYDQNKNFISYQGWDNRISKNWDFDLVYPRNAAYFRACAFVEDNKTYEITAVSEFPSINRQLSMLELDVTGNYTTFEKTGYLKNDGTYAGKSLVSVNASIKVNQGDKLAYSGTYGYSACAFLTKYQGSIVGHYGDTTGQSVPNVFEVPAGVDEILFSSYGDAGTTPAMVVKKVNSVFYACQQFNDRLQEKSVVFDGDSICAGVTGIPLDDPKRGWGWAHRIGAAHNMDWHNVSVSGGTVCSDTYYFTAITGSPDWSNTYYVRNGSATSTLDLYVQVTESTWDGHSTLYTKGSARHWESTYIETIHTNYPNLDYLIFEACLNDMYNGVPKGELAAGYTGTFETTKFIPALEHLFQQAITLYPQTKLGIIIPHITSSWEGQKSWVEATISVCKKWAVPFINLFEESGLVYPMTSQQGLLYADTAHLLSAGYDYITPKIESWLADL